MTDAKNNAEPLAEAAFVQTLAEGGSRLTVNLINSWEFNALALTPKDALLFFEYVTRVSSESVLFARIKPETLRCFVETVRDNYKENPYHRWEHAVDVTHTTYRYLALSGATEYLQVSDRLGLLVGAVIHDVGHLGVNNQFLVETGHDLAVRFNDRSPLENFHCWKFFSILEDESTNIFAGFSREETREIRKVIIEAVIHTDNLFHFPMIKDLNAFISQHGDKLLDPKARLEVLKTPESRMLVNKLLLHSADISNPLKPFAISEKWANLVMSEFFAQGDQEKQLGIPLQPLNDRSKVKIPESQIGFIEFFVAPLELCKLQIFPIFADGCQVMLANMAQWAQKVAEKEALLARGRRTAALFQRIVPSIVFN